MTLRGICSAGVSKLQTPYSPPPPYLKPPALPKPRPVLPNPLNPQLKPPWCARKDPAWCPGPAQGPPGLRFHFHFFSLPCFLLLFYFIYYYRTLPPFAKTPPPPSSRRRPPQANSSVALNSQLSTDTLYVRGAVGDVLGMMAQYTAALALGVVLALVYDWRMALLITATLPFLVFGGIMFHKMVRGAAGSGV